MTFRVLTVDDDPAILIVEEKALSLAGFEVWSAPSGEAGVEETRRPQQLVQFVGAPRFGL